MALTIDAHQHFWQLSQPFDYRWLDSDANRPIRRDFLPEHLEPLLKAAGIERSIFVQTQHNVAENRWALGLADQYPYIAGVVGWIDLAHPACEEQLVEFRRHPKFVGVRHITQDEPDDDFIVRPDLLRGLKVLEKRDVPFDLLFYVKHLRHAEALARQLPNLRMVIDHLAKPRIKDRGIDDWLPNFRRAAAHPNVYCKLSGMMTEAAWHAWQPSDLRPYVDAALECFGPRRLMFGSDWPVCELGGTYTEFHAALRELLAELSSPERDAIFGDTARRFYQLPTSPEPGPNPGT
jgi:L-fuconolactonase